MIEDLSLDELCEVVVNMALGELDRRSKPSYRVLEIVAKHVSTKKQIAAKTGLSVRAVDKAIWRLELKGFVRTSGTAKNGAGRPENRYRITDVGHEQLRVPIPIILRGEGPWYGLTEKGKQRLHEKEVRDCGETVVDEFLGMLPNRFRESPDEPEIVDDKYLCERYRISTTTSWRMRRRKHNPLPHFFVGGRVRYRLANVAEFFEPPAPPPTKEK